MLERTFYEVGFGDEDRKRLTDWDCVEGDIVPRQVGEVGGHFC